MRKVLSIAGILFSAVLVTLPLSGCGKKQMNSVSVDFNSAEEKSPQTVAKNSLDAKSSADIVRLPMENLEYKTAQMNNFETIGAQFFLDEKRSYQIANAIYHYRDHHNTFIFDQNIVDIQQSDPALLVEIAASQAPHIDQYSSEYQNLSADSPIGKWIQNKKNNGYSIGMITYGDVVRAQAKVLYGESYELPRINGRTIRYDKQLDLYYLDYLSASLATDYPVIIEEHEVPDKENILAVRAVTLCYWQFNEIWSTPDGRWESDGKTIDAVKQYVEKQLQSDSSSLIPCTFYLNDSDGILRVVGYQKG